MFATAMVVSIPLGASYYFAEKPTRRWKISWCCRAARVQAGYSQLEHLDYGYAQLNLGPIPHSGLLGCFGMIFGRSGSGKTTLLQLLADLSEPTFGSICIQKYDYIGIVFQFPERYLADTVLEEVTFGWPRQKADLQFKEQLALNLQNAFKSVGLTAISLDEDPQSLSGGFKRRLALAIQLVQTPDLLLLDEPLAGLGTILY
ncbi:hypothetical protein BS78_K227200 [Paspalum vaginatum]|uniref:ABC transporter domain-containing protein n=1 Tax=Paspalum vaginatum TaxID=158149 RepID=A0A9W7X5N4_9POAL|nr:hypothetical protein BS78_K227200 [Paspalum vaginatum]